MTDASSCCIRTSTPTIASLQLLVNNSQNQSRQTSRQNVNYNYLSHGNSTLMIHHPFYTPPTTTTTSSNKNTIGGLQQQKIYQSGLNKNLVASISTITSDCGSGGDSTSSPRTFSTNTNTNTTNLTSKSSSMNNNNNTTNKNYSNFIYPISQQMTTHLQPIMLNSAPQPPMYRPAVVQVVHHHNQNHQNKTNLPPLLTCQMETKKKKPSTVWTFFLRILSCFNVFKLFHKSTKTTKILSFLS